MLRRVVPFFVLGGIQGQEARSPLVLWLAVGWCEGLSEAEVQRVLGSARTIAAIETVPEETP